MTADDDALADEIRQLLRGLPEYARRVYWILDADGEPRPVADVQTWAIWFEQATADGSRVLLHDRDERPGAPDVLVSTVFLGLDHAFGSGPPLLWETMILGGVHDGYQRRYSTRDAAIAGHRVACALMNESTGDK